MNTKAKEDSAKESRLELKYCERCGSLWLRPAGGGQVYCVACARAMNEMPPASYDRQGGPRMPKGPRWGEGDFDRYDEDDGLDLDAAGGVA
jgi:hypothetical protein